MRVIGFLLNHFIDHLSDAKHPSKKPDAQAPGRGIIVWLLPTRESKEGDQAEQVSGCLSSINP